MRRSTRRDRESVNVLGMNRETLIRYGGVAVSAGVVGATIGFFARGGWTADWVGAIGTWVGSLGAIAAIVWAVHTFQLERGREREEREKAAAQAAGELVREAARVSLTLLGGRGYLGDVIQLNSVHLDVINNTDYVVRLLSYVIDDHSDPTVRAREGLAGVNVKPDDNWSQEIGLNPPWPALENELNRNAMRRSRRAVLTYRFDGRTWECATDGVPTLIS